MRTEVVSLLRGYRVRTVKHMNNCLKLFWNSIKDARDQVDVLQHRGQGRAHPPPAPCRQLWLWGFSSFPPHLSRECHVYLFLHFVKNHKIRPLHRTGNLDFEDFRLRSSRIPLPETLPDQVPLWSGGLKAATTFGQVWTSFIQSIVESFLSPLFHWLSGAHFSMGRGGTCSVNCHC